MKQSHKYQYKKRFQKSHKFLSLGLFLGPIILAACSQQTSNVYPGNGTGGIGGTSGNSTSMGGIGEGSGNEVPLNLSSAFEKFTANPANLNYQQNLKSSEPYYHARPYPEGMQTIFHDLLNRKPVNGQISFGTNKQFQVPASTPYLQYNELNPAITLNNAGQATFGPYSFPAGNSKAFDSPIAFNREGTISNDTYRKSLKYSGLLVFDNELKDKSRGYLHFSKDSGDLKTGELASTGWILDYQLPQNKNDYPLTWYWATNAHVARALSKEDSYSPYQYENKTNIITKKTSINTWDENALGAIGSGPKSWASSLTGVVQTPVDMKLLYVATDFLKSKPHDFYPDYYSANIEEIADFAVIEVTYKTADAAKASTQDYYHETKPYTFLKQSYLTKRNEFKSPDFYSAGFPNSRSFDVRIATNKRPLENGEIHPDLPDKIKNQGSPFANTRWHTTFSNYEGIIDNLFYSYNYPISWWGKVYNFGGISYMVRHDAMEGGSSGSRVVNQNNEIVGIHYADWADGPTKTDVGLDYALKSERFLYNNVKDAYVPEYDLVYGGGADQKTSYKDALKKVKQNQSNFKTHLFPNGLNAK